MNFPGLKPSLTAVALLVLLTAPALAKPPQGGGGGGGSTTALYTWTSLGITGNRTTLNGINSRGDVVGGTDYFGVYGGWPRPYLNISDGNGGRTTVDLWNYFLSRGFFTPYDAETQTGILGMEATAINDLGQIVGVVTALRGASGSRSGDAFFYSPATEDSEGNPVPERFHIIVFPVSGPAAYMTGVNNSGVAVGAHYVQDRYVPFIWSEQSGLIFLETFDASQDVIARGINSSGEICGDSTGGVAWRYSPGTGYSAIYSSLSAAGSINDAGQVVGTTRSRPSSGRVGFRAEPDGNILTIKMPKTMETAAFVINSSGDVSGRSWDGTRYRLFLFTDATGGIDLLPVTSGVPSDVLSTNTSTIVTGINDAGQICGSVYRIVNSTTGQRDYDGFLLTPVPAIP